MIKDLKDLEAMIKLCRKYSIEAFEVGDIKMSLGQAPTKPKRIRQQAKSQPGVNPSTADLIETDGLTADELLFYSVTGQTPT